MDNDKESSFGLVLLLIIGYFHQITDWFRFARSRLIKLVKNKGSAGRPGLTIHRDAVKSSDVVAESGR
jgi:hypothetical protein